MDVTRKIKINIVCFQETVDQRKGTGIRWGEYYIQAETELENVVEIDACQDLNDKMVTVKKIGNIILSIKLALKEFVHDINAYNSKSWFGQKD